MDVSGQICAPAALTAWRDPESVWTFREEKNLLPQTGIERRFPYPVAFKQGKVIELTLEQGTKGPEGEYKYGYTLS